MMNTLLECRLQEALATEALFLPPLKIYFEEVSIPVASKFIFMLPFYIMLATSFAFLIVDGEEFQVCDLLQPKQNGEMAVYLDP